MRGGPVPCRHFFARAPKSPGLRIRDLRRTGFELRTDMAHHGIGSTGSPKEC